MFINSVRKINNKHQCQRYAIPATYIHKVNELYYSKTAEELFEMQLIDNKILNKCRMYTTFIVQLATYYSMNLIEDTKEAYLTLLNHKLTIDYELPKPSNIILYKDYRTLILKLTTEQLNYYITQLYNTYYKNNSYYENSNQYYYLIPTNRFKTQYRIVINFTHPKSIVFMDANLDTNNNNSSKDSSSKDKN